jgi:hypothetical protein
MASKTRSFEEPHSPNGTYTTFGSRWVIVGQTQDHPPFYNCLIPRTVRIRMITTRPDSGDEENIIMNSTDGEGVSLQIGGNPNFVESPAALLYRSGGTAAADPPTSS